MEQHVQPVSTLRNVATIVFIVVTNSFGNLLLAMGTKQLPDFQFSGLPHYLQAVITNPDVLAGTTLLALWMFAQLSMLSWSDLTYVLPVTASGYVIAALLGTFVLGETISFTHWIGILLISLGAIVVAETAPRTVHEPDGKLE
ncbi:MAG TPA: hypothetical protein VHC90_05920 [Bryobacteraceae bacterium]|nr:hypothetical protein [Bryobacteraceae bacterium]